MTIIACANNMMVADSKRFSSTVSFDLAPGHQKIMRAPDGSLVGCAGTYACFQAARTWILNGMNFNVRPKLPDEQDNKTPLDWIWLQLDGRVFRGDHNFDYHEVSQPETIGVAEACWVWHGAFWACDNPVRAIEIAIEHCQYVDGKPQIEYLRRHEPGSIIEVRHGESFNDALRRGQI